jgi:capsular exopolysaccharide synthesis family protein
MTLGPGTSVLPVTEAYARLFMNVAWTSVAGAASSLVITSPLPGDGKTTTAANLAITLAQRGQRVLLVDADLRRGHIGTLLRSSKGPGYAELLLGTADPLAAVRGLDVGYGQMLSYIPAGHPPPQPAALLHSERTRALHAQFRAQYDVVIYDTPPVNAVSDAAILGKFVDTVLVVARAGSTATEALAFAVEQLRIARVSVRGIVLNDVDPRRDATYDGAYRYYGQDVAYTSTASHG